MPSQSADNTGCCKGERRQRRKQRTEAGAAVAECEGFRPKHDAGTATRHYRAFWQRRCRAAAARAVLKPQGGNCAVLPKQNQKGCGSDEAFPCILWRAGGACRGLCVGHGSHRARPGGWRSRGSIGVGLRVLSLSGSVGNVAACGLYALLCLLPAGIALRDIRHRWPLVGFSAVLGPALYFLINPGLLAQRMGGLPQEVGVAMLGS